MSAALSLLVLIGVFALAIGLLGTVIAATDNEKLKLRAVRDNEHLARQPWDAQSSRDRGNR